MWHVVCPPVVDVAPQAYEAPPVTASRWKELCQQVQQATSGMSGLKHVIDEDRKALETEGHGGMIRSIINRTRCTGYEAIEIVRKWIDTLKEPVDEDKFQRVNRDMRESSREAMVAREAGQEG